MKKHVVMISMMLAVISALPNKFFRFDFDEVNISKDTITSIVNDGIEIIKEAKLDPYINEGEEYSATLDFPFPGEFKIGGYFKNFKFTGLSNIIINYVLNEGELLLLDLSLPRIEAVLEEAVTELSYVGGLNSKIKYDGSLAVSNIHLIAQVRKNFFGPTLDDLNLAFSLGNVESNVKLVIGERDFSKSFNKFLEYGVPKFLAENEEELNKNLSQLMLMLIDRR